MRPRSHGRTTLSGHPAKPAGRSYLSWARLGAGARPSAGEATSAKPRPRASAACQQMHGGQGRLARPAFLADEGAEHGLRTGWRLAAARRPAGRARGASWTVKASALGLASSPPGGSSRGSRLVNRTRRSPTFCGNAFAWGERSLVAGGSARRRRWGETIQSTVNGRAGYPLRARRIRRAIADAERRALPRVAPREQRHQARGRGRSAPEARNDGHRSAARVPLRAGSSSTSVNLAKQRLAPATGPCRARRSSPKRVRRPRSAATSRWPGRARAQPGTVSTYIVGSGMQEPEEYANTLERVGARIGSAGPTRSVSR